MSAARLIRMSWRPAVAMAVVLSLTAGAGASSVERSEWQKAESLRTSILEEVRAAAAAHRHTENPSAVARDAEPLAEGAIRPDAPSTLRSETPAAAATFSGHEIDEQLDATLTALPDAVASSAESETGGVAIGVPVEIEATTAAGAEVTSFPAEVTTAEDRFGVEAATEVTPGIELSFGIDAKAAKAAGVDLDRLRVYTREGAGDPWTMLPSWWDADAKQVRAESDHLSEFVVIGTPVEVPPGPTVVLDPDDDYGWANTPAPRVTELPLNVDLTNRVKALLEEKCLADVVVTRGGDVRFVSTEARAAIAAAANPAATLTLAFDALTGSAWGTPSSGGTFAYSRGGAGDALRDSLVGVMPVYTDRPAHVRAATSGFPHPDFSSLPGAVAHMETLYMDHTSDRVVIDHGMQDLANGVFTGLGQYLQSQGYDCADPVTGGWPAPPSQAQKDRWRALGLQYHNTYIAEPVAAATGNLVEQFPLFALTGPGGTSTGATLIYNSQDGRLARVGAGWSFTWGARAQRFDDDTVMVVRGDGASYMFTPDGSGGYVDADGSRATLVESGGGRLTLTTDEQELFVFDAADIDGIGELISFTDRAGRQTTLTYGPASWRTHQFVPLTSITDSAGQVIQVSSDAVGRVTGFTLPDGRTWGLGYDAAGNLTSLTDAAGGIRRFSYDDAHQLLTATDPTGVLYLKNEYDTSGRVVKQWDADGQLRTFDYSDAGRTVFTDVEGGVTEYRHEGGRITEIVDPTGESAGYQYNDDGDVERHVDESGRVTRYAYDDHHNLVQTVLPDGSAIRYTYTPAGDLASVTDVAAGLTTSYDVDARGLTTATHAPDGTVTCFEYDAAGNQTAEISPSGATTRYAYDSRGNVTSVTDPDGNVTRFAYDASNRVVGVTSPGGGTTSIAWGANDQIASSTNPVGGVTTYAYDANGHVTSSTDPLGAVTRYGWDELSRMVTVTAADGGVTRYTYDGEDNPTGSTDAEGGSTELLLDQLGRVEATVDAAGGRWERSYLPTGEVASESDADGNGTEYAYDELGRLVATTSPTGSTSRLTYDAAGNVETVTDAAAAVTRYSYDALGQITKVTDALGASTEYAYDVDGNLVGVIDRNGNPTLYTYSPGGRVLTVENALGQTAEFGYDADGNQTSVTDSNGAVTRAFDAAGRLVEETDAVVGVTRYAYDVAGQLTQVADPLGHVTAYTYDPVGRLAGVTDPLGNATGYRYDLVGNTTAVIDAAGVTTAYRYDPRGLLTQVIEAFDSDADAASDANVTTSYAYTASGLMSELTDPNGNVTSFAYNRDGQLSRETDAAGVAATFRYDDVGRLASRTDGNGTTVRYGYTALGDVASTSWPGTELTFEYDANQNLIAANAPTGATGFIYDELDRVTQQIDATGARIRYSYDDAGHLEKLTLPGGSLDYTRDAAGRITGQASPWGDIDFAWDADNKLTAQSRSNGVTTDYGYDADDRITSIVHTTPAALEPVEPEPETAVAPSLITEVQQCRPVDDYLASRELPSLRQRDCVKTADYLSRRTQPEPVAPAVAGDVLRYDYSYDEVGNVTSAARTLGAPDAEEPDVLSREFAYDDLSRLVSSEASTGELNTYAYDAAGNRTGWDRTGGESVFSVDAVFNELNQLTSSRTTGDGAADASFSYDRAGNRTQQSVAGVSTSYAHDPSGRLTGLSTDGRSVQYGYDALGRNTSVADTTRFGTQTTSRTWSGGTPVQQSTSGRAPTTLLYDAVGQLSAQGTPDETRWDLLDRLGSVVAQSDADGLVDQLADYSDYGLQNTESTGWDALAGFTGESDDPTSGLNTYLARAYQPGTGSWTSADPWRGDTGSPQTLNRYAYTVGNPTTLIDVGGNKPWDPAVTVVGKNKNGWVFEKATPPKPGKVITLKKPTAPKAKGPSDRSKTTASHEEWWNPFTWSKSTWDTWQNVGAIAAGVAVAVVAAVALGACIAATAGICAGVVGGVALTVLGGAAIGAGSSAVTYALQPGEKSASGWVETLAWGGGLGALTAGIAPAAGAVIRAGQIQATQQAAAAAASRAAAAAAAADAAAAARAAAQAAWDLDALSASGARPVGANGLTRVGQKLTQHGGQGVFPEPTGSPAAISAMGQQQLDEILTNPATVVRNISAGSFAGGRYYILPDGRGAAFDAAGVFQYFGVFKP